MRLVASLEVCNVSHTQQACNWDNQNMVEVTQMFLQCRAAGLTAVYAQKINGLRSELRATYCKTDNAWVRTKSFIRRDLKYFPLPIVAWQHDGFSISFTFSKEMTSNEKLYLDL